MQESPYIVQWVLKKKCLWKHQVPKGLQDILFFAIYLNTACLGFDQKSKKYAYNIIILSKLFKKQENKNEIFHHINHAMI